MGVITPSGVVGRVLKVNRTFSVIQLILDRNNAITAVVQRTRDEGIIQGTDTGQVVMKYLPPLSSVETGDVVVTSGLDNRFPKGMIIGIINQVEKKTVTPFKSATLTPHADFSKLEEVVVLLETTSSDERDGECFMQYKDERERGT
jgi:rod shape-determining protein MreC